MRSRIEKEYLADNDEELFKLLSNFSNLFPSLGVKLGITSEEIYSFNTLYLSLINDIDHNKIEEAELKKKLLLSMFTSLSKKIKDHPSYKNYFSQGKI